MYPACLGKQPSIFIIEKILSGSSMLTSRVFPRRIGISGVFGDQSGAKTFSAGRSSQALSLLLYEWHPFLSQAPAGPLAYLRDFLRRTIAKKAILEVGFKDRTILSVVCPSIPHYHYWLELYATLSQEYLAGTLCYTKHEIAVLDLPWHKDIGLSAKDAMFYGSVRHICMLVALKYK